MEDLKEAVRRHDSPTGSSVAFRAEIEERPNLSLHIQDRGGASAEVSLGARDHGSYIAAFDHLASSLNLRRPQACTPPPPRADQPDLEPVLTTPISPEILYGYGDPCVVRVGQGDWRLLVTSNDAPNAFPILSSSDLKSWSLTGFVFPAGAAPAWAATGLNVSDFWAPELHRVGDEWWVCFSARILDGSMAIGIARGSSPDGPFTADETPLVAGDVIDSHILIDRQGAPWLVWKKDDNGIWPALLAELLHSMPDLTFELFPEERDRRTATLAMTLWPWTRALPPMEQFFVLQTFIEAVAADLAAFVGRLERLLWNLTSPARIARVSQIATALRTRIYAQKLSPDGKSLQGESVVILQNDLPWEGHLIEGAWITQEQGLYYLLYAGNDFSTGYYGVGAAVGETPAGPYRKGEEIFIGSSDDWWGPGHPSVATLDNGEHQMFLHAYPPGRTGYKEFRALLTTPLRLGGGEVQVGA